jgi:V/A-type H+-transporting ATPase subunit I
MKKVTLAGMAGEKPEVLEKLQEIGCMQLVPLTGEAASPEERVTGHPKRTLEALRYLLDSPQKRRQTTEEGAFDLRKVVRETIANRERRREVADRIDELRARIDKVEPWGDFHLPAREALAQQRFWFYVVPCYQMNKVRESGLVWQVVHKDHRNAYVVVLSEKQPAAEAMPVARSRLGARSLSELRLELERSETEMEEVTAERWALTRWISLMTGNLDRAANRSALKLASSQALDTGELFAVQGWVPVSESVQVTEFAASRGLACIIKDPEPTESPPVLLHNRPAAEPGEDLVGFYQLPGYRDWDPSGIIYYSFSLFFAMILADAGYGAVIGLGTALFWKRLDESKRFRKMLTGITVLSLIYGVLVGSYFGIAPSPSSTLFSLKLLEINDFDSMMRLTIGIGALHLIFANLRTAWHRGLSGSAMAPVGWAGFLLGGLMAYLFWGGDERLLWASGGVAGIGVLLIILFSSERPIQGVVDVLKRLVDGVVALTGLSKVFGDVLSYLRLFALGLSSASLALTFNQLASDIRGDGHGIALLFGILVFLLGHTLNFALGVMSGVVHGLRLNLIELYGWSIFGEGSAFRAFRKKETVKWTS